MTCMQRVVAPEMISRVSSYDYLGSLAFYPAGLALAGPLADAVGVTHGAVGQRRGGGARQPVPALLARRPLAQGDGAGRLPRRRAAATGGVRFLNDTRLTAGGVAATLQHAKLET